MARRHVVAKRVVLPDPKFKDSVVTKFMNCMMLNGKKSAAEKAFYGAIDIIEAKGPQALGAFKNGIEIFHAALENTRPLLEVKSRRVGGSNYQVPVEVRPDRRQALAIRWLIEFSRDRAGRSMREKLAAELFDAANKRGGAIQQIKRVQTTRRGNHDI